MNLFSSFGYFEDVKEDLQVLRNLYDSLRPRGVLVMDMMGKEPIARTFQARSWYRHPDGSAFLLEEQSILGAWERVEDRWTVIEGGEQKVFTFRLRLYSGAELKAALREAGFSDVTVYGSLEGTPYDQTAKRLVAVAIR